MVVGVVKRLNPKNRDARDRLLSIPMDGGEKVGKSVFPTVDVPESRRNLQLNRGALMTHCGPLLMRQRTPSAGISSPLD